MFSSPNDAEACLIRHLHHLQRVITHRAHIGGIVHSLEIDSQLELHRILPQRITNGLAIGASDVFIQTVLGLV